MLALHTRRALIAFARELRAGEGDGDPVDLAARAMDRALRKGEDVLTALLFERLRYLPLEVTWRLLVGAAVPLRGGRPVAPTGVGFDLWPSFAHPGDHGRVEPDVVIESAGSVLVVEVKWSDVQTASQLDREVSAVAAAYPDASVTVLALGGASSARRKQVGTGCRAPTVLALDWPDLFAALRKEGRRPDIAPHERALLDDLKSILATRNPLWARAPLELASLPPTALTLDALAEPFTPEAAHPTAVRELCSLPPSRLDLNVLSSWRTR